MANLYRNLEQERVNLHCLRHHQHLAPQLCIALFIRTEPHGGSKNGSNFFTSVSNYIFLSFFFGLSVSIGRVELDYFQRQLSLPPSSSGFFSHFQNFWAKKKSLKNKTWATFFTEAHFTLKAWAWTSDAWPCYMKELNTMLPQSCYARDPSASGWVYFWAWKHS